MFYEGTESAAPTEFPGTTGALPTRLALVVYPTFNTVKKKQLKTYKEIFGGCLPTHRSGNQFPRFSGETVSSVVALPSFYDRN